MAVDPEALHEVIKIGHESVLNRVTDVTESTASKGGNHDETQKSRFNPRPRPARRSAAGQRAEAGEVIPCGHVGDRLPHSNLHL